MSKTVNYTKTIVDASTGETITRKMNDDEVAELVATQAVYAAQKAEAEAKATARQAVLDRLGLTADEAKLLLG